ncbi:MAG: SxtJ family membrane protein [Candidatus Electryonea clarkiae]|nr:SxtJ family membrane protein [Candidatus Electryonea clarkiae]MDP8287461.1 SxtJ family membrane protein [Candidatus Electryonea clarkiae]
MNQKRKTNKELRKFAVTMAVAFAIVSVIVLLKGHSPAWIILLGVSGLFLAFGFIAPQSLRPIEWIWMQIAYYLAIIVTHILVTLTYIVIIIPMGLFLRIIGKDLLKLRFDKKANSYWISIDPDSPSSRPEKPY